MTDKDIYQRWWRTYWMQALNDKLVYLYHLFPPFNLGRGLVQLSALDLENRMLGREPNPYKWDVLGRPLSYMVAEIFGYLLLTLLIDNGTLLKIYSFGRACITPASMHFHKLSPNTGSSLFLPPSLQHCDLFNLYLKHQANRVMRKVLGMNSR